MYVYWISGSVVAPHIAGVFYRASRLREPFENKAEIKLYHYTTQYAATAFFTQTRDLPGNALFMSSMGKEVRRWGSSATNICRENELNGKRRSKPLLSAQKCLAMPQFQRAELTNSHTSSQFNVPTSIQTVFRDLLFLVKHAVNPSIPQTGLRMIEMAHVCQSFPGGLN
jgi:hypothetical protein